MIRTYDFIYILRRNDEQKVKFMEALNKPYDVELDIKGWHLSFNQQTRKINVTSNGKDLYLLEKFIPAEIDFNTVIELIDM